MAPGPAYMRRHMTTSVTAQGDFFALPDFEASASLISDRNLPPVIVIGCGKNKRKIAARASELYTSTRFKISKEIAANLNAVYFVLSAKHGLIGPDEVVEPYDVDIHDLSAEEKKSWARSVLAQMQYSGVDQKFVLLAEKSYVEHVVNANRESARPVVLVAPFLDLEPEHIPIWLERGRQASLRIRDMTALYSIIDEARKKDQTFKFSSLAGAKVPPRGVYIFLDPSEENFLKNGPRIVRIGTHAVSLDSKSTLRTRLRSHLGKGDGLGNHRGSIFRLHVGRAMQEAGLISTKSITWGEGQNATADVRREEVALERKVSEYLRNLEVFIIPLDDAPSKDSLRACVETQLIALCTERFEMIENAGAAWLGRHSPDLTIARSGLWNLRDVAKPYRPDDVGSVSYLMSMREKQNND